MATQQSVVGASGKTVELPCLQEMWREYGKEVRERERGAEGEKGCMWGSIGQTIRKQILDLCAHRCAQAKHLFPYPLVPMRFAECLGCAGTGQ